MLNYIVQWSAAAEKDLTAIIDFISNDSVDEALRVLHKISARCASLYSLPHRGRIVPELKQQGISLYRELTYGPWRTIYRVSEKSVYILAVIDARRNVEDILLERFTL